MHLLEVLIAGGVFAVASGSSVQLWSAVAVQAHQLTHREQLEQQIEHDRLMLQTLWRTAAQPTAEEAEPAASGCRASAAELLALASSQPVAASLRRELQLSADGRSLRLHWSAAGTAGQRRDRVVTPAGLGLCGLEPPDAGASSAPAAPDASPSSDAASTDTPLTESPVEEVPT
ncbi:MAG: hypothetical protein VKI83_09390 [Synechococcaceae cyanobacterium]|nr:hypothetical protein [Synechococcaceae cyanobacterium]